MSDYAIRPMEANDKATVIDMMRGFYASEAVHSNGSEEVFSNDVDTCVSDDPFASGYVFVREDGSVCGYAMLAHSFSTEYGVHCVWIEDIYLKEEARSKGLSSEFFDHLRYAYPDALHRLEAEHENLHAMEVYKRKGFEEMPYVELFRKPL